MKRVYLLILVLTPLLLCGITVNAAVNKNRISLADRLEFTIQIQGNEKFQISEPQAPKIELFSFANMRSSTLKSSSMVNFQTTHKYTRSYIYSYVPLKEGSTTIPTQSIRIGNEVYTTNAIDITVVKSSSRPSQSSPSSPGGAAFADPAYPWSSRGMTGNTMILALPQRQTVYKGEPTIITYYLYTDQMVRSLSLSDERDFPGYGKSAFEQPSNLDYEVVNYQGKRFQRALIKRLILSPNELGELRVPEISGTARIYEFGYMSQDVRSSDAWLEVLALPQTDIPPGFTGAVGSFRISEDISATEINLGEAVTFSLRIAGKGNFNQFGNPDFPQSEAQVSNPLSVDKLNAGIEGSRVLYYTIIPSEKGDYTLPTLSFSWFDPQSGGYRDYHSKPGQIKVKSANVISYFSGLLESGKAQTLRPMLSRATYPAYPNYLKEFLYWLALALILAATGYAMYFSAHRIKRLREPELYARKMADRALKKYLAEAAAAALLGNKDFYTLAENGLMRYLSEKFGIPLGLSTAQKMEELATMNIAATLIEDTQSFIDLCELQRFAPPAAGGINIEKDMQQMKNIVSAYSHIGGSR